MIKTSIISFCLLLLTFSCTKKTDNYDYTPNNTITEYKDKILTPAVDDYVPTNPTGGQDPDIVKKVGVVEHEKRIRLNTTAPIILGQAAGNISFDHTFAQGLDILSNPYSYNSKDKNELTYYEQIWVKWGINKKQGRKAQLIRIMKDYKGALAINENQSITMQEDLGDLLSSDEKKKKFANDLIKIYYGEDTLDCVEAKYCKFTQYEDGSGRIDVLNNMIFFDQNFKSIAQIIMFTMQQESDPAEDLALLNNMKEPILPLHSLAGINFTMYKEEVESILHSSGATGGNQEAVYKENVWIKWNDNDQISTIRIMEGYLGTLTWDGIGEVAIGQDLSAYFATSEKTVQAIITLYQQIYQKEKDYSCFEEESCKIAIDTNQNYILQFFADQKISFVIFFGGTFTSIIQMLIFPGEEL